MSVAEKDAESERLRALISTAQKQLKRATKAQSFELRNRITVLGKRLALLERRGEVVESITASGQAVSPYARILARRIKGVIGGVLRKHAELIRSMLERA